MSTSTNHSWMLWTELNHEGSSDASEESETVWLVLGQEPRRCERHYAEAGTTTATHRRKCYSGGAPTMRFVMLVGSLFHSIRVVQCTIDYTGHVLHVRCTVHFPCPIQTRCVESLSDETVHVCCMAQAIKILSAVVAWKVSVHRCGWTPRYARFAVARASDRYCRERQLFTVVAEQSLCERLRTVRKMATTERVQEALQQRIAALETQLQIGSARAQRAEQERSTLIRILGAMRTDRGGAMVDTKEKGQNYGNNVKCWSCGRAGHFWDCRKSAEYHLRDEQVEASDAPID